MRIEIGGDRYTGWLSAECYTRMDALARAFSFETMSADASALPFANGAPCQVFVDDELQLTGHVEIITGEWGEKQSSITCEGRDRLGDVADSKIGQLGDMVAGITLKEVIERLLEHLGIDDVGVIDNVNPPPFEKKDIIAAAPAMPCKRFLAKWSRKRQVLIRSTPEADLVIERATPTRINALVRHRKGDVIPAGGTKNNVLSARVKHDDTQRYASYQVLGQQSPTGMNFFGAPPDLKDSVESGTDRVVLDRQNVRIGRQWVMTGETSMDHNSAQDRAEWERDVRRAKVLSYTVTLHGYRNQTDDLWRPNTLIQVDSPVAGIESEMLVEKVAFTDGPAGKNTILGLTDPLAYTLAIDERQEKKKTGTTTGIFAS